MTRIFYVRHAEPNYNNHDDAMREYADKSGLSIEVIDDFRERKVDSVWIEDFATFTKRQWSDFQYKLSDGECLLEFQSRNITALIELIKKYSGKNIVIGGHGTALGTIINYYDSSFCYDDFDRMKYKLQSRFLYHSGSRFCNRNAAVFCSASVVWILMM